MPKTVVEYLNEVDYSFPGYVPSDEAIDFVNFIKLVNDGGEENETPLVHLRMMDDVFTEDKRNAILCHRGLGKTTLFAEYLILYIACFGFLPGFGKVNLMLYVSDSIENGVKNLRRNVEHRYQNSAFLQEIIPNVKMMLSEDGVNFEDRYDENGKFIPKPGAKFTDVRLEFTNINGHKLIVKGYGAKTGLRGSKEMAQRPTLAVADDIISDEDARSATVIGSIENTMHKALSKALHPKKSKTIWLGTPFNQNDPLYKAVESGAWISTVYPIAEEFTSLTTEEEFRGSWPDRFTYEYVKDEFDTAQAMGRPEDFDQELMLRIMSDEQRLVNDGDIVWYDLQTVMKNRQNFNYYITTDLTTSGKASADYAVIMVWAISRNEDRMLVDLVLKKQPLNKSLDDLFRLTRKWSRVNGWVDVGIEVDGQQGGFLVGIDERMIRENNFFNIVNQKGTNTRGIRSRAAGSKIDRFMMVLSKFKLHKIWFPNELKGTPEMKEVLNELSHVALGGATSAHDDALDAISQLEMIEVVAPSGIDDEPERLDRVNDNEVWAFDWEIEEESQGNSYV